MKLKGKEGEFYFHMLRPGKCLSRDNRLVVPGVWMKALCRNNIWDGYRCSVKFQVVNEPNTCSPGMHACRTLRGVQQWGIIPGWLCLVQLKGKVKDTKSNKYDKEKSVALERRVVAWRYVYRSTYPMIFATGMRSEDVARWVMNKDIDFPKVRG